MVYLKILFVDSVKCILFKLTDITFRKPTTILTFSERTQLSQKGNAIAVCYAQKSVSYIISLVEKNSSIKTHKIGYYGQKQSTNTKDEFFRKWQGKFNATKLSVCYRTIWPRLV